MRLPLSLLIDAADGISIHAPVKGATHGTAGPPAVAPDFNPRTREGCDVKLLSTLALARLISIHAPVKGATQRIQQSFHLNHYFNPRTREGCDAMSGIIGVMFDSISIHAPVKGATYVKLCIVSMM